MNGPSVQVEQIPAAVTVECVCRVLCISRSVFYAQKDRLREIGVLVEVLPRLTRRPIYLGAPIARHLSVDGQAEQIKRTLRLVK